MSYKEKIGLEGEYSAYSNHSSLGDFWEVQVDQQSTGELNSIVRADGLQDLSISTHQTRPNQKDLKVHRRCPGNDQKMRPKRIEQPSHKLEDHQRRDKLLLQPKINMMP